MKCVVCKKNWEGCPHWDHESVRLNERMSERRWRLTGLLGAITVFLLMILN